MARLGTAKKEPGRLIYPNTIEISASSVQADLRDRKIEETILGAKDDEA